MTSSSDWLQEEAYPGQPLGRTILGPALAACAPSPAPDLTASFAQSLRAGATDPVGGERPSIMTKIAPALPKTGLRPSCRPPRRCARTGPVRGAASGAKIKAWEHGHSPSRWEARAISSGRHLPRRRSTRQDLAAACLRACFQETREKRGGLCYTIYFPESAAMKRHGASDNLRRHLPERICRNWSALTLRPELKRSTEDMTEAWNSRAAAPR